MNLNDNQLKAVQKLEGPLRIVAGPGSGKTRTIVSKIAYLIENNHARPDEILTITFTNKAANEIKDRVAKATSSNVYNIYTYHGWCHYFLRVEANEIGLASDFVIMDTQDKEKAIKNIIKEENLVLDVKETLNALEQIAREDLSVKELEESEFSAKAQIATLYKKYQHLKAESSMFDFDDLILEVKRVLKENKSLAEKWANKYKYIFIDEFQDTNNIQFEIIRSITNENSNITVVGDPDQNIYSWRGANISLINNFNKYYPNAETIFLDINYRSTPEIINSANALISNNKERVKEFHSEPFKAHGDIVEVIDKENEILEAYEIARRINRFKDEGYKLHEMAILVRTSFKTRPVETALNDMKIPYIVIGAMKFFERAEVKQTLKFLLFMAKQDNETLLSIINEPPKKFGPAKVMKARVESDIEGISIWEWLQRYKDSQNSEISDWIEQTSAMLEAFKSGSNPANILSQYLDDINYSNRFFEEPNRTENIQETINIIRNTINGQTYDEMRKQIIEFVNSAILSSRSDVDYEDDNLNIITAHSAKGTEFPIVFIFSMNEEHWPSRKAIENGEYEEERRVAYVAMTRAMEHLIITTSSGYEKWGKPNVPSRFIDELLSIKNSYNYIDNNNSQESDYVPTDEELDLIGKKIIHVVYGRGEIVFFDGEFITVAFANGQKMDIMYNHPSYTYEK